ncbi:MAG: WecB/TagA/CpsF family glycosyltransferase [Candidatus Sumerlaeaceae bacterium]
MNGLRETARVDFLGLPLLRLTTKEFIDSLVRVAAAPMSDAPVFVTYINAWCTVLAQKDEDYRQLLKRADGVYADGQAIVWASELLRSPVPERVNAADFIVEFCSRAAEAGVSLFLLGSQPAVAESASTHWKTHVPGVHIAGSEAGYFSDGGEAALVRIGDTRPDVLLVGLGVPLQEKWVAANLHRIPCKVVWCIGAMFEYHGKARARAPVWMRRAGLEWLFRLMLEPKRLGRRYLLGNLQFIYLVMRARLFRLSL